MYSLLCFLSAALSSILQAPIDLDLTMIWTMQAAYTKLQNYLCVWERRWGGRLPKGYKNAQMVKEHVCVYYCSCSVGWSVSGVAFSSLLDPQHTYYLQNVQSQANTKNTHAW